MEIEGEDEKEQQSESSPLIKSKKVKRQLLDIFRTMTDNISETSFEQVFNKFDGPETVTNKEQIVQTFKDRLYQSIADNFIDMWHGQELDTALTNLNFCKGKCKENTKSWRPTGKTPEEQIKFLRVHYLKKKIAFIQNVLTLQQESFNVTCVEVEHRRRIIENLITRRDNISKQMDIRITHLNKMGKDCHDLQKDLLK